jgi:hypothetical protein
LYGPQALRGVLAIPADQRDIRAMPRIYTRTLHDAFPVIPTDEEVMAELGLATPA